MKQLLKSININDQNVNEIHAIGIYVPKQSKLKRGSQGSLYIDLIEKVKSNDQEVTKTFAIELAKLIESDKEQILITSVPSSKASVDAQESHGITAIAKNVAEISGNTFLQLKREEGIIPQKTIGSHKKRKDSKRKEKLQEFEIDEDMVRGKTVLLLDDICTTGASMSATKERLKDAGADAVLCIVLAKSYNQDNAKEGDDFFTLLSAEIRNKLIEAAKNGDFKTALQDTQGLGRVIKERAEAEKQSAENPEALSTSWQLRKRKNKEEKEKDLPTVIQENAGKKKKFSSNRQSDSD